MKNRALAVLLVLCLAALPVFASAATAAEVPTQSRWVGLLSDVIERLFAGSEAVDQEEPPPAAPPAPVAPQPTADPQESISEGGTEQAPDLDPIG